MTLQQKNGLIILIWLLLPVLVLLGDRVSVRLYCQWQRKRLPTEAEWARAVQSFTSGDSGPSFGWVTGVGIRCAYTPAD